VSRFYSTAPHAIGAWNRSLTATAVEKIFSQQREPSDSECAWIRHERVLCTRRRGLPLHSRQRITYRAWSGQDPFNQSAPPKDQRLQAADNEDSNVSNGRRHMTSVCSCVWFLVRRYHDCSNPATFVSVPHGLTPTLVLHPIRQHPSETSPTAAIVALWIQEPALDRRLRTSRRGMLGVGTVDAGAGGEVIQWVRLRLGNGDQRL
jgi:hypothetical protein